MLGDHAFQRVPRPLLVGAMQCDFGVQPTRIEHALFDEHLADHLAAGLLGFEQRVEAVLAAVLDRSGYLAELRASRDPQDEGRLDNLSELLGVASEYDAGNPDGSLAELAASAVTVVTQPNFIAERGDQYRVDVPAGEHHELWRVASLRRAGVPVALSTDSPFGDADPWAAMRAAVHRRSPSGVIIGEAECVSAREALAMFLGEADRPAVPRPVEVGAPGDLCVLSTAPAEALGELDAAMVAATVIAGDVVFERS